jgi:hypothetical protein
MSQGVIGSPVSVYIQEGSVATLLSLHGELFVVDTLKEWHAIVQFFTSMGPGHEVVINVPEPVWLFAGSPEFELITPVLKMEAAHFSITLASANQSTWP